MPEKRRLLLWWMSKLKWVQREIVPAVDGSTNLLERIGPFQRGFPSATSKVGQSLERIRGRGHPIGGVGFAPYAPDFASSPFLG